MVYFLDTNSRKRNKIDSQQAGSYLKVVGEILPFSHDNNDVQEGFCSQM